MGNHPETLQVGTMINVYKADDGNPDWEGGIHFKDQEGLMCYIEDFMSTIALGDFYVGEKRTVEVEVIRMTQKEFDDLRLYEP